MTDHMQKQFAGYMTACYGSAWAMRLPPEQLAETRQAFFMGALSYQGLALGILNPETGPTTPEEEARGEQLFAEIADEIEAFGQERMFELFGKMHKAGHA